MTPKLSRPHASTATLLNTGSILIAGGVTEIVAGGAVTATAELFNPGSLTFSGTGSLTMARAGHTATLLPDGKVLIVGGYNGSTSLASAELYDPATGTFSSAGNLQTPRFYHLASLEVPGPGWPTQVVVYGGYTTDTSAPDDGWELWDEAKNAFIASGRMAAPAAGIPQPFPVAPPPVAQSELGLVGGLGPMARLPRKSSCCS